MRELNAQELSTVQGGFVITATVATLIVSGVIAGIYLINSLVDLYITKSGGQAPTPPTPPSTTA